MTHFTMLEALEKTREERIEETDDALNKIIEILDPGYHARIDKFIEENIKGALWEDVEVIKQSITRRDSCWIFKVKIHRLEDHVYTGIVIHAPPSDKSLLREAYRDVLALLHPEQDSTWTNSLTITTSMDESTEGLYDYLTSDEHIKGNSPYRIVNAVARLVKLGAL